ncbi:protein of unknown function [Nitrospina watsonii]|uniref:Uncharacterized protein n=1 Tax=Nitrospina watsonii TaxID=1323948 RepID=A0ABM9HBM3_9BACT|nr:protein of unknown function [Nitrospina watsonii]
MWFWDYKEGENGEENERRKMEKRKLQPV